MTRSTRIITCRRCNGAGNYYQGRTVVRCDDCGGSGQLLEEFESHARDSQGGHCALVLLALVGGAVSVVAGVAQILV